MTPIDSEHAALLRGIAKNLKNETARKVYSDWLQEKGDPGWLIVASYPPEDWPIGFYPNDLSKSIKFQRGRGLVWKLPWLEGHILYTQFIGNRKSLVKKLLLSYANGTDLFAKEKSNGGFLG